MILLTMRLLESWLHQLTSCIIQTQRSAMCADILAKSREDRRNRRKKKLEFPNSRTALCVCVCRLDRMFGFFFIRFYLVVDVIGAWTACLFESQSRARSLATHRFCVCYSECGARSLFLLRYKHTHARRPFIHAMNKTSREKTNKKSAVHSVAIYQA